MNFARLLRNVIPEEDFVGRYGGDEFMAVIYHTSKAEVEDILKYLRREKDRLNGNENPMSIDYACCRFSNDLFIIKYFLTCTFIG